MKKKSQNYVLFLAITFVASSIGGCIGVLGQEAFKWLSHVQVVDAEILGIRPPDYRDNMYSVTFVDQHGHIGMLKTEVNLHSAKEIRVECPGGALAMKK